MYGRPGIRSYQEVTMNTITPERMIVMLYEGIFRNMEAARKAIVAGDIATRVSMINKAQAIISELKNSLDHDCGATFTHELEALYNYMYNENIELLLDNDLKHIDNLKRVLDPIYRSWCEIPTGRSGTASVNTDQSNDDSGSDPAEDKLTDTRSSGVNRYSDTRNDGTPPEKGPENRANLCVAV